MYIFIIVYYKKQMSIPIPFFLKHFQHGRYIPLANSLKVMGITTIDQLEEQFLSLRDKKMDNALLYEFVHVDLSLLLHEFVHIRRLYSRYIEVQSDRSLGDEVRRSLQREPREALWVLSSLGELGLKALAAVRKVDPASTERDLSHFITALSLPKVKRALQEAGINPKLLTSQLKIIAPLINDVQVELIMKDIDKELEKITAIREPSPPPPVQHISDEQREFNKAYREYQQSRNPRKTPPKYSIRTKQLVVAPSATDAATVEDNDYGFSSMPTERDLSAVTAVAKAAVAVEVEKAKAAVAVAKAAVEDDDDYGFSSMPSERDLDLSVRKKGSKNKRKNKNKRKIKYKQYHSHNKNKK